MHDLANHGAGSSSFVDTRQPSKAPRQDEDGRELIGTAKHDRDGADSASPTQGISNRPAKEEHAFPNATEPEPIPESDSNQMGGNRGGV